jgi:PTS system galactitol-specific IIA component
MVKAMDVFVAELEAEALQMLELIAAELERMGYVDGGYAEALVEREINHPTGLEMGSAVTDAEHVLKPAIVIVAHSTSHFCFRRMDEPEKPIPVKVAFLLVIKDPERYMRLLSDLAALLQDRSFLQDMALREPEAIAKSLQHELADYGPVYKGHLNPGQ